MANDSRFVLSQLVRSGIWSSYRNLLSHRSCVLDAESIVTHLYKRCVANHLRRRKALSSRQQIDYYASTIVDYGEFGRYVKQLLDLFATHSISVHIVYRGKYMEAPLFGLLPAQIKKNTQRVLDQVNVLIEYDKSLASDASELAAISNRSASSKHRRFKPEMHSSQLRPSRPNLALNVFKQIVNEHRKRLAKKAQLVQTYQSYYSSFPTLAKLARDFKCPVLTNDGDFIIMDVRAGFVLFEDFCSNFLEARNAVLRQPSTSSISSAASTASNASTASRRSNIPKLPRSPASSISDTKSLFNQPQASTSRLRFHYHSAFLKQHPGLNQALALHLFPLTTGEFIVVHAKSMVKMRIYDREFAEKDLNSFGRGKKYHMAAARLEMVCRYLCTKDPQLLSALLKGEAHRLLDSGSTFDDDYKQLFNYYAVSYHFQNRLKFVTKYLTDASQLAHIENSLLERECTADYLLGLICCAVGKMSSVTYNKSMQFEDLQTRHSAFSMLDRGKRLLMSILSDNKAHKAEHSGSLSDKERGKVSSRFKKASLVVVDRQQQALVERSLETTNPGARSPPTVTMASICKKTGAKEAVAFMELAFNQQSGAFVKLAPIEVARLIHSDGAQTRQLAILLNLHRFSLSQAAHEDAYFKQNYLSLSARFEMALANQFLHCNHLGVGKQLVDLINKHDLENVCVTFEPKVAAHRDGKQSKISLKSEKKSTSAMDLPLRRHIRHLIELLSASMESYCELNAFLNYPLPRLELATCYNPILLFNLTLYNLVEQR